MLYTNKLWGYSVMKEFVLFQLNMIYFMLMLLSMLLNEGIEYTCCFVSIWFFFVVMEIEADHAHAPKNSHLKLQVLKHKIRHFNCKYLNL